MFDRLFDALRSIWAYSEPWTGWLNMFIGVKRPTIEFGDSGIQGASQLHTPGLSWLHLRVSIKPPSPWEKRFIERCGIRMRLDGQEAPIDLRWQSRERHEGDSEVTLEYGRPKLIPIAQRDTNGLCFLTDENYFVHQVDYRNLTEGRHTIQLEIYFGDKSKKSEAYILNVPPKTTDNGHFWLRLSDHLG